ncbi:ATP-binding protein [Shimazuella kribbensis]|uniref:ATP-binding protein n=1 Tax=Shimazuella kribbensis TaxID=139808 RepID=UPI000409CCE3|nr:ATP-binding protein [Shimazuella kribbensis]
MIIERVHFHGFGRFQQKTISFQPGLNVIQASNESGKSTLLQGIFALLYGGAQEGKRVRREADWYSSFRPWMSELYGGEIDYSIDQIAYRLIRNLLKGREQEQLLNRLTGEELQQNYLFDQRKERKIIESQIGLSGELFRRTAYITSYSSSGLLTSKQEKRWQLKLAEKLNSLIDQGEEVELTSVLKYLEDQLNELGKTEHAKQKPFGVLKERERSLREQLHKEKELQTEYLQARVDLQHLLIEQGQLEQEYQILSEQHQRLSISLQCKADWYRLDKIHAALEEWEVSNQQQIDLQDQIQRLEENKIALEPPFRMQVEDIEECNSLHYQDQTFEKRIALMEEQIQMETETINHRSNMWIPTYPFLTIIGIVLTIGSTFFSSMWGLIFGSLTGLIWAVPALFLTFQLKNQEQSKKWSIQSNQKLLEQYKEEQETCKERLNWWKKRVGTNDVDVIRDWWHQTQVVEKVEWELEQLLRNQPVRKKGEGKYLQQKWGDGKREFVSRYQGAFCQISDKQIDNDSLILSRETVHKSMQLNSMQVGGKKKSAQELEFQLERIQQLHIEWEQIKEQLEKVEDEREAISIAKEALQEAYQSRQGNVAPILQQISSTWIKTVTNKRYDSLYANFSGEGLSARIPETGRKEKIDQLSTGTLMQMVFAMKMSIVQYISDESKQRLPILLDDCFVYYDKERLASILPLLGELSKTHQILLCTCHTREIEQLKEMEQPFYKISLIS